jgi:hypothetical protein
MILPDQLQCQLVQYSATPTGPASYITTNLVRLVKFAATKWVLGGLIGDMQGLNGLVGRLSACLVLVISMLAVAKTDRLKVCVKAQDRHLYVL